MAHAAIAPPAVVWRRNLRPRSEWGGVGMVMPPGWSEARTMMLRGGEKRLLQPGMVLHFVPAMFAYREYDVGLSKTVLITEIVHEVLACLERKLFVVK